MFSNESKETESEEMMPLAYAPLTVNKKIEENEVIDERYEVNPKDLEILPMQLGTGHFGDVYRALLRQSDGKQVMVAVKKLKISSNVTLSPKERAEEYLQHLKSLQCETQIMSIMGEHPNILRLIGAITKNRDDFCVITEYCEYGSLENFLRDKEKHSKFINECIANSNDGYRLPMTEFYWKVQEDIIWEANFEQRRKEGFVTTSDLMWFAFQIANAMEFLTNNGILHRDLALRNMLLTNGYIVKVADFGLSRQIHDGIYQPSKQSAMPIAYLAPEVLQYSQFSKKSESWAFGVVLWELFTLAGCRPYELECGHVNEDSVSAFLGSDRRLPMPQFAPFSMRRLIALLWNKEPLDRPDFMDIQTMIIDELQDANPQLATFAQQAMNLYRATYSKSSALLILQEMDGKEALEFKEEMNANESSKKNITALAKLSIYRLARSAALVLAFLILGILLFFFIKPQENDTLELASIKLSQGENATAIMENKNGTVRVTSVYVAGRWSWSFNASLLYSKKTGYRIYGPSGVLDLGSDCGTAKWIPFAMREKENASNIPFLLEYVSGPQNLRAWRSMALFTRDGREIMVGNDFHRNGFLYNKKGSWDTHVWAPNSTYFTNTTDNDPLTLKIEVFVDRTWAGCEAAVEAKPPRPINYEEECNLLPTNVKLFYNGTCYAGSNTQTQFDYAIKLCNDIPSAAISRLAWIESEELLEMLKKHLIVHERSGLKVNVPYYIGAKQFSEDDDRRPSADSNWYWINSEGMQVKRFPANFSLWSNGEPDDNLNIDENYVAVFNFQKKLSDVDGSQWFRYLCEYKAA